jgi:ABC-type multidrug transport system fused ATPase/permease subunit
VARILGFPPGLGELIAPPTRRRLLWSVVGSFVISLLDMLGVLAMIPMMQYVSGQDTDTGALGWVNSLLGDPGDRGLVITIATCIVAAFVLKDIFSILFRRWQLRVMADQEVYTSTRMLEGYLVGPYAWYLARNTADKVWTIEYAVQIGYIAGVSSALGALTEVLTISLIFVSLLIVTPVATVSALLYFGLAGLAVQRFIRPRVLAASRRSVAATQATSKITLQALGAGKEIKLRRAHAMFVDGYFGARMEGARARASSTLLSELPKYLLEIVFVLGIGMLAVGVTATTSSQSGLVLLGVFVAAGSRILPSAVRLISNLSNIRFAREPLHHLVAENRMQTDARLEEEADIRTSEVPRGDIEVHGLTFAYGDRPDEEVLRGVDVTIRTGTTVALVGASGAGKSTFVDLLLALHRPGDGMITVGGVDITHNTPAWQRQLAVVPQDVYLLDESLRTNIIFDQPADDELLADVVRRAQLRDLVASLPEGLDTEVGERGARLSGGQRQRIGIARALYRRPEVLFLDEATSALDNETERRLTETVESLKGSMTIIIVAHRLSTVRNVDELIFMSSGRVASTGSFEEVTADSPEFAHLVRLGSLVPQGPGDEAEVGSVAAALLGRPARQP